MNNNQTTQYPAHEFIAEMAKFALEVPCTNHDSIALDKEFNHLQARLKHADEVVAALENMMCSPYITDALGLPPLNNKGVDEVVREANRVIANYQANKEQTNDK
jgi:hypothetical protein